MNDELKKLTPLEHWKNFLLLVEAPAKARLLDCEWKDGLEQYDYFKAEIETALKDYEQIKNMCESYGIEFSLVNVKEALFTLAQLKGEKGNNWENYNKKLKALNEILALHDKWLGNEMSDFEFFTLLNEARDKYGLLKEALL